MRLARERPSARNWSANPTKPAPSETSYNRRSVQRVAATTLRAASRIAKFRNFSMKRPETTNQNHQYVIRRILIVPSSIVGVALPRPQ